MCGQTQLNNKDCYVSSHQIGDVVQQVQRTSHPFDWKNIQNRLPNMKLYTYIMIQRVTFCVYYNLCWEIRLFYSMNRAIRRSFICTRGDLSRVTTRSLLTYLFHYFCTLLSDFPQTQISTVGAAYNSNIPLNAHRVQTIFYGNCVRVARPANYYRCNAVQKPLKHDQCVARHNAFRFRGKQNTNYLSKTVKYWC
jgi:hypothetical protein